MKSAVAHAIKTNHFPEATNILKQCWTRVLHRLEGKHFTSSEASYQEQCMMRGWSINHEGLFSFTTTHDLCDARFTRKSLEQMVRTWYQWELDETIERDKRDQELFGPFGYATKAPSEYTLDEWIFDVCKYKRQ